MGITILVWLGVVNLIFLDILLILYLLSIWKEIKTKITDGI